ncbi:MAG: DegT/DnrJ/EryC1/StrS family aminotransferase [Solirubrobacteraceae bacterium]
MQSGSDQLQSGAVGRSPDVFAPVEPDLERIRFGELRRQHEAIEGELRAAFERLLRSSAFTLGEEVERFESDFAGYCDVGHCVGVSSGTAALTLMLRAYNVGPGDEVIVPAHTFIASALAATYVGATPVLCDVLDDTGLIDPDAARAMVGPRTAAVIAVHLYGQACDMDAIDAFAGPNGLLVLEDAAQAAGASYRGRPVGSLGAAGGFSFYPGKNLGALGDGGAICTDDALLAARLRRMRNLGQRSKGEHSELGYNERLDGLQAALLRVKLAYLDGWNHSRRRCADRYRGMLEANTQLLHERPESPCIYHIFPTRFENRDAVSDVLNAAGIETGVHYGRAVHQHAAWDGRPIRHGELPVAEAWASQELSLPMHPDLTPIEIERVADVIDGIDAERTA